MTLATTLVNDWDKINLGLFLMHGTLRKAAAGFGSARDVAMADAAWAEQHASTPLLASDGCEAGTSYVSPTFGLPKPNPAFSPRASSPVGWLGAPTPESDALHALAGFLSSAGARAGEARRIASRLIDRFGTVAGALMAPRSAVLEETGGQSRWADLLLATQSLMGLALREPLADKPVFTAWSDLQRYLQFALASECGDSLHALTLDTESRLLRHAVLGRWEAGAAVVVHPRSIAKVALEGPAGGVILVHAVPGRPARINEGHVRVADELRPFLARLNVLLVDVVSVGIDGAQSMSALRVGPWQAGGGGRP